MMNRISLCVAIFLLLAEQATAIRFFHRTTPIENDYEFTTEKLGKGQFSLQVVKATHRETGKPVAIKAIKVTKENYLRANREALILRYLANVGKHEFVVGFVDSYFWPDGASDLEEEGIIYLVMDLVPGEDLIDYLQKYSPLSDETTIQLGSQIASAHRFFQKTGIAHRDLKADNIRVYRDGAGELKIVILDFGMAKFFNKKKSWRDTSCGSPHYVPPEVYQNLFSTMEQRDAFHVGVILYAMMTGRFPWKTTVSPEHPDYLAQIKAEVKNSRVVPIPRMVNDEKHDALATFIENLLTIETIRPNLTYAGRTVLKALPDASVQILHSEKTEINLEAMQYILEYIDLKELALDKAAAVRSIVTSDFDFVNPFYDYLAQEFSLSPKLDIAFIKRIKKSASVAGILAPSSYSIVSYFIQRMDVSDETKRDAIIEFVGDTKLCRDSKSVSAPFFPIVANASMDDARSSYDKVLTRRMTESSLSSKMRDWQGMETIRDMSVEDDKKPEQKKKAPRRAVRIFSRLWNLKFGEHKNRAGSDDKN